MLHCLAQSFYLVAQSLYNHSTDLLNRVQARHQRSELDAMMTSCLLNIISEDQ